jgi:release factor glutamine methyltransferase
MKSIRLRNSNGFDFEIEQSEPEKFESLRNREERFWNAKQLKEENGIEGFKEFMGHQFIDSPDVLTPKESSAILVKSCISKLAEVSKMNQPDYHLRILDLGTGSGCLLIASILEFQKLCPHSKISGVGIDISESALEIAKRNANHLEVESFVQFFKCSFKDISCHFFVKMGLDYCKFDLIISNPPYFPSSYDSSRSSMKIKHQNDPSLALFAGPTGMEFYEEILKYSIEILHEHGYLILETGSRIHASLISFISKAETKFQIVEISSDAQGIPRSICLNRKPGKCNSS